MYTYVLLNNNIYYLFISLCRIESGMNSVHNHDSLWTHTTIFLSRKNAYVYQKRPQLLHDHKSFTGV